MADEMDKFDGLDDTCEGPRPPNNGRPASPETDAAQVQAGFEQLSPSYQGLPAVGCSAGGHRPGRLGWPGRFSHGLRGGYRIGFAPPGLADPASLVIQEDRLDLFQSEEMAVLMAWVRVIMTTETTVSVRRSPLGYGSCWVCRWH